MRHLFVTNDFPPKTGGIESYLTALCSGFDAADVCVVAPSRPGHQRVDEELPFSVFRLSGRYLRASRAVAQRVIGIAKEQEADAVHFLHALPLGRLGRRVGRATGRPVNVFAHGSEVLVPARVPFVRRSLRGVLTEADLVSCVSRFTQDAVDRFTAGAANTAVIHPTIDLDRFSLATSGAPVRERLGLGSRIVVLFVSRLVKRKGAETLVRAAADLPRGTAVLVVGSGPEDATLRRVAEDLELTERVRFCGRVPDGELPAFYAAADVFCMPCSDRYGGADTEGLGIVYLEAAASGLPAVAGRCGGSVEAVLDGITGVVLDDPSPEGLAKALRALAKDGALRARLGAAGRERAEATFAPSVQASNLEKAVSSLSV